MTDKLPPDRGSVSTEQPHVSGMPLETLSSRELIEALVNDQRRAVDAVLAAAEELACLVTTAVDRLSKGGRVIYVGAGTSGRLGVLDASECPPTFNADPASIVGVIAGGDTALRQSSEGAEDDFQGVLPEFDRLSVSSKDVLIGIAAGGTTPYVLGAIELAKERGAATALLSGSPRETPRGCDLLVVFETGGELLTGSTRLTAGTATKLALNAFSTSVFTALGKVRGSRMIDLHATNDKLHDRCLRIVCELFSDLDRHDAAVLLEEASGSLRSAVETKENAVPHEAGPR
jgi:N-acetylmuramic acid 6-phosphate etherase